MIGCSLAERVKSRKVLPNRFLRLSFPQQPLRRTPMSTRPTEVAEAPRGDSYYCEIPNDPCAIVMFGASGDLARRKLIPALYDLALHSCLAPRFKLLGFARTEMNDDAFRRGAGEFLPKTDQDGASGGKQQEFLQHLHYLPGNYD